MDGGEKMRFYQLAGNEGMKRILSGSGALPHAIILSGEPGSGRHTAAREIAQSMVCDHPEMAPCGACPNCRKAAQGIHPDVMPLERFLESGDVGKETRVYAVRAIREDAQIRPNEAACKVYIIDQPMNPQAQNAMLKLLEEGPPYARFLMLAENSASLLETVRSRCAELHTTPLTESQALQWLRKKYPDRAENDLRQAAHGCHGLLGRAEELLSGEQTDELLPYVEGWVEAIAARDEFALMKCVALLQNKKLSRDQGDALYARLMEIVHQALLQPLTAGELPETLAGQAAALGASYDQKGLLRLYEEISKAREMGKSNVAAAQSAGWLAVKCIIHNA